MTYSQKKKAIGRVKILLSQCAEILEQAERKASDDDVEELPIAELQDSLENAVDDADSALEMLDAEAVSNEKCTPRERRAILSAK